MCRAGESKGSLLGVYNIEANSCPICCYLRKRLAIRLAKNYGYPYVPLSSPHMVFLGARNYQCLEQAFLEVAHRDTIWA